MFRGREFHRDLGFCFFCQLASAQAYFIRDSTAMKDIDDFVFKNLQCTAVCLAKIEKTTLCEVRRRILGGLRDDLSEQPLNHNVRCALKALACYLFYSNGKFAADLVPILTRSLAALPHMRWVDDGLVNKNDKIPIQEQFSFCFNTTLSDLAAKLPDHRDAIVTAQIDAIACAVSSIHLVLEDTENVSNNKAHTSKLVCYVLGLLRSFGRYSHNVDRSLLSYVFPLPFEDPDSNSPFCPRPKSISR